MDGLAEPLRYVDISVLAALAAVLLRQWRRRRDEPTRWAALTFALLAVVFSMRVVARAVTGDEPGEWLTKLTIVLAALFPYFLYRFAASFTRPSRWVAWAVGVATAVIVVWALALPELPLDDEPRPAWFTAFISALLADWIAVSLFVAAQLWVAGRGQGTVARYRMRSLAVAAITLSAAIAVAGLGPGERPTWLDLLFRLLVLASALLFILGFSPAQVLRTHWRRSEEHVLREAIGDMARAATPEEVTATVLPRMASIVGARGVALVDENEAVVATHGLLPADPAPVRLDLPSGSLVVATSAYAPFFGDEELELLRSLAAFTTLALDRARLFANERDARLALERADELKSGFIALASHELRTPAAVIHGIAATLHVRGDELTADQVRQLRNTLYAQTDRMRLLVDQLLDLSRLEADGIKFDPQPVNVLTRVQEIVLAVAGERAGDVELHVPAELEAVADATAFDRIVSNLVVNAFRYGATPITVSAEQPDRYFRLSVEDRGRGVPPEFVPELFDRFTRSTRTRDLESGGAGLGLAIAKSYAEAHGGDLFYEPAEPHGARFQLVLPRLHAPVG